MPAEREPGRLSADAGRPDKRGVQRAFSAAAGRYDHLADLQRRVADRLISHVVSAGVDCRTWLDLGTGTGYCASRLADVFPRSGSIAVDLAEGMLRQFRCSADARSGVWLVAGDAEDLPLADRSIDLAVSNLALQWCPEPERALRELSRVLKANGHLFFTTFGPETLSELREAWAQVDGYSHVNAFRSVDELSSRLTRCDFTSLDLVSESQIVRYADVAALMHELKGLGAHNVTAQRPRGLMGKGMLARMTAAYREACGGSDAGIEASFEVIYGAVNRGIR